MSLEASRELATVGHHLHQHRDDPDVGETMEGSLHRIGCRSAADTTRAIHGSVSMLRHKEERAMFKRVVIILGIAAACMSGSSASAAYAATPTPASGAFDIVVTYTGISTADGNTILQFTFLEQATGALTGIRVGSGTLILHPDGTLDAHNSGVFTGTIAGSGPGTAIWRVEASGTINALTGRFEVTMGSGGLAGVFVQASFSGAAVGPTEIKGTYAGQVETAAN